METKPTYSGAPRLTTAEAARIAGVHPQTIRRWANAGILPERRTPGGQRRFSAADVEALLTPIPKATKALAS